MTHTLMILFLILALAACQVSGPTARPPASVNLAGAQALYLQPGGGKATHLAASITAPDGAVLMKLLGDATTGEATFEDDLGNPVTVTITRTLQLSSAYLLLAYDYAGGSGTALVTLATGELRALPVLPDNWDRIRVSGAAAYYVAGGAIYRVDLDTLAAADMSQGDRISGGSLVFLDASANVHTLYLVNGGIDPANQIRIYYADGSPFDALGWGSPDAYQLYEETVSPTEDFISLEDEATGTIYRVRSTASGLSVIRVVLDATGVHQDAEQVLDASLIAAHDRLGTEAGKRYLNTVAFADETRAAALTVVAGAITGCTTRTFSASIYDRPKRYAAGKVYVAYGAGGISAMDMAGGTETQLVDDAGITALEVVADQVFYSAPSGTWKYDTVAKTKELYSADPEEIVAVTR